MAHSWTLLKLRHSICSNYRVFQKKLSTFTRKFPILISSYLTCRIESIGHNMLTNAVRHHLKALTNVRARIWSAHIQWIVREISLKWCLWYYLLFDKFYRLWTNQIKLITSLEPVFCNFNNIQFGLVWYVRNVSLDSRMTACDAMHSSSNHFNVGYTGIPLDKEHWTQYVECNALHITRNA